MRFATNKILALATFILPVISQSSSCSTTLTPTNSVQLSVASGYRAQLIATGLATPRSIQFDTEGNLLVVETKNGNGSVSVLTLEDDGGTCVSVTSHTTLVTDSLNHGLAISEDGKTIYASSPESVWSWSYNAMQKSASNQTLLVTNMTTDDHTTRTLLLSQKEPGLLLVSRGSTANIDLTAASLASGHSEIRAFNLTNMTGQVYQYDTQGLRLGWGLRNSVGVSEHPVTGGIYSVENSADQISRDGQDIHENNPGEEMNFHGYLNGTEYAPQGQNYGYPYCFAVWDASAIPNNSNLTTGSQFSISGPSPLTQALAKDDSYCAEQIPPRLTFQAHMAPLDIKFNDSGNEAWVTYHGSWDRTSPVGYKLSRIAFSDGEPVAPSNSTTALVDVFANANNSVCPNNCFRPVGMAIDNVGRIFVSSDATGEIYVVIRDGETATANHTSSASGTSGPTSSSTGAQPTASSAASKLGVFSFVAYLAMLLVLMKCFA